MAFRFIEVKNVASISLLVIGSNSLTTAISNNTSTTISPTTSSNSLTTTISNNTSTTILATTSSNSLMTAIPNNTSTTISPTNSNYLTSAISTNISDKEEDTPFSIDKTVSDGLSPITLYRAIRSTLNDTMTDILTRPYRPTTVIFHSDTPQPVKNATQGNIIKKHIDKCLPFLFNLIPFFPALKIMKFF